MTCVADNFDCAKTYAQMIGSMVNPGYTGIATNSLGKPINTRNAASVGVDKAAYVVTCSGLPCDNPLWIFSNLNIWLDSRSYGLIEIGHQFIPHNRSNRV